MPWGRRSSSSKSSKSKSSSSKEKPHSIPEEDAQNYLRHASKTSFVGKGMYIRTKSGTRWAVNDKGKLLGWKSDIKKSKSSNKSSSKSSESKSGGSKSKKEGSKSNGGVSKSKESKSNGGVSQSKST